MLYFAQAKARRTCEFTKSGRKKQQVSKKNSDRSAPLRLQRVEGRRAKGKMAKV